jgi:Bacterial Ig-like domain/Thrombospondin type 3 repeat
MFKDVRIGVALVALGTLVPVSGAIMRSNTAAAQSGVPTTSADPTLAAPPLPGSVSPPSNAARVAPATGARSSLAVAGLVTTVAGSGIRGSTNGPAGLASFNSPCGIAVDGSDNVFVADLDSSHVRKIPVDGNVFDIAGTTVGFQDGNPQLSQFRGPCGVALDKAGNLYIADIDNHRIRIRRPSGFISTFAGSGVAGTADGPAAQAQFNQPYAIALDNAGNAYVVERNGHRVRKISPSGVVSTLAGSAGTGYVDGPGASAKFFFPCGVAVDASGLVYVADWANNRIRTITPAGIVSTLAGNGLAGFNDGNGQAAQFNNPCGISFDESGQNLYVADFSNHAVRVVTPSGDVQTVAGGASGYLDGPTTTAQFKSPFMISVRSGNVYVTDYADQRVRKISGLNPCGGLNDPDGDCLSTSVEANVGTDPLRVDTDGDGLLDSWEVDPRTPGAGIRIDNPVTLQPAIVTRDEVFGPYRSSRIGPAAPGLCDIGKQLSKSLRVLGGAWCNMAPPDPLVKDSYLELDFQDCASGSCPGEVLDKAFDDAHHAPSLEGITDTIDMFKRNGIRLHVTVDERIEHKANCDQAPLFQRQLFFGSLQQRRSKNVIAAKKRAVRWAWSGHSSAEDNVDLQNQRTCDNPNSLAFTLQGFGFSSPEKYDFQSPAGGGNGDSVLITLGIAWNCRSELGQGSPTDPGLCYRSTQLTTFTVIPKLGVFPTKKFGDPLNRSFRWPLLKLLGEREPDASRQLWGRTLSQMLGRSMGLTALQAKNEPVVRGRKQSAQGVPLTPELPDDYAAGSYAALRLAPVVAGSPQEIPSFLGEPFPYEQLAKEDPDDDGQLEGNDVCPGIWDDGGNGTGLFWETTVADSAGDACNSDLDGDGQKNPPAPPRLGRTAAAPSAAAATLDPFPYDTDNDGTPNDLDLDDDNDGVLDLTDNCRGTKNPDQANFDTDGFGDLCDADDDNDGLEGIVENFFGASDLSASNRPENLAFTGSCGDGADNDGDGLIDIAEAGCQDVDGDQIPDASDKCPSVKDDQTDLDNDGVGRACDLEILPFAVSPSVVSSPSEEIQVQWSANQIFEYTVRLGPTCLGPTIQSSTYLIIGSDVDPEPVLVSTRGSDLQSNGNMLTVCGTFGNRPASYTFEIPNRPTSLATPTIGLSSDDEGATVGDSLTSGSNVALAGTASPNTIVNIVANGITVGQAFVDGEGLWSAWVPANNGLNSYSAVSNDVFGNSSTSAPYAVTVDNSVPDTGISLQTGTNPAERVFAFTATKPLASFQCSVDGATFSKCSTPLVVTSAPGPHSISVRAVDVAGNVDRTPATAQWTVTLAPTTELRATTGSIEINGAGTIVRIPVRAATFVAVGGAGNQLLGGGTYATTLTVVGAGNNVNPALTKAPLSAVTPPFVVADFRPGSPRAISAGAKYVAIPVSQCSAGNWTYPTVGYAPGTVLYVPCNATIGGTSPSVDITLVAEGAINISGAGRKLGGTANLPAILSASSIAISGSNGSYGQMIGLTVTISGAGNTAACGVVASSIKISGANTRVLPCP